jgi:hypothetical protein
MPTADAGRAPPSWRSAAPGGLKAPEDHDYGLHDFDVADLAGNMIFFGMESQKAS